LAAAGAAAVQDRSGGQIGRIAEITAPALTVLTVILFMGEVSGAHLNPIVTVAFALRHDFHWRRVPGYILAQLLGALLAALLLRATFGDVAHLGPTLPGSAPSPAPARTWTLFIATAARPYTRRATITLAKTLLDHVER
jgi:aquaporin Z